MRLKTINTHLALRFQEISDVVDARLIFEDTFRRCVNASDVNVFSQLEIPDIENIIVSEGIPEGYDFQKISDAMDEKYFDAEDEGRSSDAFTYFSLARLMSALSFAAAATEATDFAEATYEAIMSQPNPQAFADQIFSIDM